MVIAIISILAAMLLPALGKARVQALAVKCISNLKQVDMYMGFYCEDHDGWTPSSQPRYGYDSAKPASYFWCHYLFDNGYASKSAVHHEFRCPAFSRHSPYDHNFYGMRTVEQGRNPFNLKKGLPFLLRADGTRREWKSASEMILFGDSLQYNDTRNAYPLFADNNYGKGGGGLPDFRHNRRCSVGYGDGHAKAILVGELADTLRPYGGWTFFCGTSVPMGCFP